MPQLTHLARLLMALDHREPDRIPMDFGSNTATGIFATGYVKLKQYLDIAVDLPLQRVYPHSEQVWVDPAVQERFDVDAEPVDLAGTNLLHYADRLTEQGYEDEYGVSFLKPPGSDYAVVGRAPFVGNPDANLVAAHRWPDPMDSARVAGLKDRARHLRITSDRALVVNLPGRFLSFGQNLCGFADWMVYLANEPRFVEALMDKALEIQGGICVQVLDEVGADVDVVMFADDLGTEQSLQISPRMYRKVIKPRQKQLFDAVKRRTQARIMLHSDGAIAGILPDLIEAGIDIINPVQPTCAGMDTATLKREFGREVTFWGSVDTQRVLPFGTQQEVIDEVRRRIDDLAPGGGFVLAAVHNLQPDVPSGNIVTMFDTARSYGLYRRPAA